MKTSSSINFRLLLHIVIVLALAFHTHSVNSQGVGVNVSTPASMLDVEGNVSIGSAYSGSTAAPANGAIIEGKVGIGTSNPINKLQVAGGVNFTGALAVAVPNSFAMDFTGNTSRILSYGPNGTTYGDISLLPTHSGGGTKDGIFIEGDNAFVGIGTTTPGYRLEVAGGVNIQGSTQALGLSSNANLHLTGNIDETASGAHIIFNTSGSAVTPVERMRIDKDGFVGIGSNSPVAPLDVALGNDEALRLHNDADDTWRAALFNISSTYGQLRLYSTTTSTYLSAGGADSYIASGDLGLGDITPDYHLEIEGTTGSGYFGVTNAADGDIFEINGSGNVGIGDATPSSKLEVAGTLTINNGTNTQEIRTNSADSKLTFRTNRATAANLAYEFKVDGATNAFVIADDGEVGVGNSNPLSTFHVTGNSRFDISGLAGNPVSMYLLDVGSTWYIAHSRCAGCYAPGSSDNDLVLRSQGGDNFHITTDDGTSTTFTVTSAGNVGIGTTSPASDLHVVGGGVRFERSSKAVYFNPNYLAANTHALISTGIATATSTMDLRLQAGNDNSGNGVTIKSTGRVGIGSTAPTVTLDVNGSVNCTGGACASDLRWKKNIKPLDVTLEKLSRIKGVYYDWRVDEFPSKNFDTKTQVGFIAQEVEEVFPELVNTDTKGFKSMDYMKMTAILLEGMKEQSELIFNQNEKIEYLLNELDIVKKELNITSNK